MRGCTANRKGTTTWGHKEVESEKQVLVHEGRRRYISWQNLFGMGDVAGKEDMRKGVKTIIAGVALFLFGGVVLPVAMVVLFIVGGDSRDKQFKVPGNTRIEAKDAGRYYLWNNYRAMFEGKNYNSSESIPEGMENRITDAETGELFDFFRDNSWSSISMSSSGSVFKNTIGYFRVEKPCTVEISVAGCDEERVFSFLKSRVVTAVVLIGAVIAAGIISGFTGLGITVGGIIRVIRAAARGECD